MSDFTSLVLFSSLNMVTTTPLYFAGSSKRSPPFPVLPPPPLSSPAQHLPSPPDSTQCSTFHPLFLGFRAIVCHHLWPGLESFV